MTTHTAQLEAVIPGLYATTPESLPFAPSLEIRAFLLERAAGDILIYNTGGLEHDVDALRAHDVSRQYLNHGHEALFGSDAPARELGAKVLVNGADAGSVSRRGWDLHYTFSRRHHLDGDFEVIPTPGHTGGATAFLWDSGGHRMLFTGDTIYLRDDEWVAAVLESSDRDRYIESLELIRELDFDVLVPWAAGVGQPFISVVDAGERRARIDAILARVRRGEDH